MFDNSAGMISPPSAISGSRNNDIPDIKINGSANPIAPFTRPASKATPQAAKNAQSGIKSVIASIISPSKHPVRWAHPAFHRDIFVRDMTRCSIFVALHLQTP